MSDIILHDNSFGGNIRNSNLVIANVEIPIDENGLYSLNALHRASEAASNKEKAPNKWLKLKSADELINELKAQTENSPSGTTKVISTSNGGSYPGTYAHELLAISYAGWISPRFQLIVNQAFIDSKVRRHPLPEVSDPTLRMLLQQNQQMQQLIIDLDRARIEAGQAKEMALQVAQAQQYLTIREFVKFNDLTRQCPPGSTQQQFGKYMTGFCREHGWPLRKMPTENTYTEWAYPAHLLQQNIFSFLSRRNGQIEIDGDGVWYNDN